MVDALWVRGLGVEATAAVTTSMFVLWTAYSLMDVFGVGVAAYVSQLLGAGDRARAGYAAYKGLRATAVLGLAFGLAGCFGARSIYGLMHAPHGVVEAGTEPVAVLLGHLLRGAAADGVHRGDDRCARQGARACR